MERPVYCEKPLTHSVVEARRVMRAARETGLATQMGNAGPSGEGIRQLVEWVRAGVIGQIRTVHSWTNRPSPGANFDYAAPLTELVLPGNVALRSGPKLEWDADRVQVSNSAEANA